MRLFERVTEFLLDGFALQELQIVDQQNVDVAQGILEIECRLALERLHEAVHEPLGGQIQHLGGRIGFLGFPCNGLQKVGLAQTNRGMQEERV